MSSETSMDSEILDFHESLSTLSLANWGFCQILLYMGNVILNRY